MKRRVKSIFSLILSSCLLFGMLFTSIVSETRAANTTENVDAIVDEEWIAKRLAVPMQNVSLPQVAKVQQDLAALQQIGISTQVFHSIVSEIDFSNSEEPVYKLTYDKYVNEVEITKSFETDGIIEVCVSQGNLKNVIVCTESGEIFIDGVKIQSAGNTSENYQEVSPAAVYQYVLWSDSPHYGTASSYKYYLETEQLGNIPLTDAIMKLTLTAVVVIICTACGFLEVDVIVDMVDLIYDTFLRVAPTTTALSYKAAVYTRSQGTPYINDVIGNCFKKNFTWYSQINYRGSTVKETLYMRHYTIVI